MQCWSQIVTNAIQETRQPFHRVYLYGMSVTRLIIPLYIYGYPSNVLFTVLNKEFQPNYTMCLALGEAGVSTVTLHNHITSSLNNMHVVQFCGLVHRWGFCCCSRSSGLDSWCRHAFCPQNTTTGDPCLARSLRVLRSVGRLLNV